MRRSTTATAEQVVLFELIGEDFKGCPENHSGKKGVEKKVKQYFLDSCRESGWVQNSETGDEQLRGKR